MPKNLMYKFAVQDGGGNFSIVNPVKRAASEALIQAEQKRLRGITAEVLPPRGGKITPCNSNSDIVK